MTDSKRKPKTSDLTPQRRRRNIIIGGLTGIGMALLTFVILLGLLGAAFYAMIVGLLIIAPTNTMYLLVALIACLQILLGVIIGYRTTGEKHSLARNLRRGFILFTLLLIITSPAYICPMYFAFGQSSI